MSRKLILTLIGLSGTFLLYVALLPIILSEINQTLFANWWKCIWAAGSFTDYLRVAFVVIAGLIFIRGFIGVILASTRTISASKYIFWGGIAGCALLIAFWSGILNGSLGMLFTCAFLGSGVTELNNQIVWGAPPPGLNYPFIRDIIDWGWLKLALAGCSIWILGTIPFTNWWRRLS